MEREDLDARWTRRSAPDSALTLDTVPPFASPFPFPLVLNQHLFVARLFFQQVAQLVSSERPLFSYHGN